jgi:hypothetical protein
MNLLKSLIPSLTSVALVAFFFSSNACNREKASTNETTKTKVTVSLDENDIEGTIVALIDQNEFNQALEWLGTMDQSKPEVTSALQRVHLNYGLGLMNMTVSTMAQGKQPAGGMNTNMYAAMRQFLMAYNIDPKSEAAAVSKTQLQTIMSVYSTMPDRLDAVPKGIRDSLRVVGFNL